MCLCFFRTIHALKLKPFFSLHEKSKNLEICFLGIALLLHVNCRIAVLGLQEAVVLCLSTSIGFLLDLLSALSEVIKTI